MFDLKKRRSLPLTFSRESEEFRRLAVRRKMKGVTDDNVCISYSRRHSFERHCRSDPKSGLEPEDHKRSPAKRSLHRPQVPPKPPHLQTPVRSGPQHIHGPEEDQSPTRGLNGFNNPSLNCYSSSPVKASFKNGKPHTSLARLAAVSQSPDITTQKSSQSSEGRCSNRRSPISGRLRTPSPVHGKMWTYTPAKNSKPSIGLNKFPKFEEQERSRPESLSVPDLIAYLEETSSYPEKDCFLLQPDNSSALDVFHPTDLSAKEAAKHLSTHETKNGIEEVNIKNNPIKEAKVTNTPKFYCKWSEDVIINNDHKEEPENKKKECVKNEDSPEQKLFKIANEFLQTERAYVARLHLLDQVFCFRLNEEANRGSFPPEVVKNIFSNVSSIFSFHSQFLLPDLENCISVWDDSPGLGGVLLQHAPFMRMYADYVRNFDKSLELVRTWTERSSAFKNIIQDVQSLEVCGSLTLQHHMLEPVQRLPRYELLLRDYLKKLPEDHPDHQPTQKSLQTISMATIHSNSAIEKAEGLRKLLEIYEMVGEEEVVNPTNEFLREGRLVKLAARNTSAMERQLFLFNNFLLCCSPKFSLVGQRYMVRCRIGVDGMNVQRTTNEGHPFSFQVSGKEKTLELQASSEEERDAWIKVIQEAVSIFQKKNETFRIAAKELTVDKPTKELGRRAPKWIRDNEVTMCMKCHEPFNPLTRRRHHCRACGCVVCWKCSDNKAALEYDGNKLNKVCKSCFLILTTPRRPRPRADSDTPVYPSLMSGFLNYGDNANTWQRIWTVLHRNDPPVLYLYAAPQDVKPQSTIPLLGYTVEGCAPEVQGHACFCLRQSRIAHTFLCDDADLRDRWLAVLKNAIESGASPRTATESCNASASDASSCCSEDYVIIETQ